MADYIIANGQTLSNQNFGYGDTILVQAGGTLSDSVISKDVVSVTLEDGAILSGSIKTAKEITIVGTVNASDADLALDLSERKPEEGLFLNSLFDTQSISISVSTNQDKGTYRIFGNAADFVGTISVKSAVGAILGALSIEKNVLDYDITRYTLTLNEANEVCVTVSSNIPDTDDYVLLYKDSELVATAKSVDGITISKNGECDHMIVLKNGIANQVELSAGGTLAVYSGATVTGLTQSGGILSFDYTGSDTTIVIGTNQWGEFSVQNGVATNLSAQGKITLHDAELKNLRDGSVSVYGGSATGDIAGSVYLRDQATGTGISFNGSVLEVEHAGVQDSTIMSGELKLLDGSSAESIVVENGKLTIWGDGSTLGNITVKNGASFHLEGSAALTGDLFLSGPLSIKSYSYYWNGSDQSYWQLIGQSGFLDANGHTITFDMTGKKPEEEALIAYMKAVSEDAKYKLVFSDTQRFGKYAIAEKVWSFVDVFSITVNGTNVGTLSKEQTSLEYGNYRYEMQYDQLSQKLDLVISVSDNAGPEYGILYYDSEDEFHHTNALSSITVGSSVYWDMTVRTGGYLEDSILEGGNLRVYSGATVTGLTQSGGTLSFDYSGSDTTIITGTNKWGEFSVQNGVATNLSAQGKITLHDAELKNLRDGSVSVYGGSATGDIAGSVYLRDQATGTGINFNGTVLELERAGVQDSTIMSGELKLLDGSSAESIVVENGKLTIWGDGSTLGNITVKNGASFHLEGSAALTGDLFLSGPLNVQSVSYHWNGSDQSYWQSIGLSGFLDANGHTITFDMTGKKPEEEALIAYMTAISENVNYKLVFSDSPSFGTYSIAKKVGSFVDSFIIAVDETDIGVLNKDQSFVENGVYRYEMKHDALNQTLDLVISVSDNAGPEYGILYYDSEDEFHHTNALSSITVGSSVYWDMTVRTGGYLEDSILNGGSLNVSSGAVVTGLNQQNGTLSFDYSGSDTTIITGTNKWGDFSVQNGVATNLSAQGKITLHDAELKNLRDGSVSVYGGSATGDIAGSVYLRDQATGTGISFNGSVLEVEHAGVQDSTIMSGELKLLDGSSAESIVVENGSLTIWGDGSTLGNITVKNGASFNLEGSATLNGDLFLSGPLNVQSVSYHWNGSDQSYWQLIGQSGFLDANGHTITFDASAQSTIPNDIFSQYLESIVNAEFVLRIKHDTAIGSYLLAEHSGRFGQGNTKGIWDADTNTWKYQGAVYGDMDGIIEIRDENGILLANCTVNGDTEYFGRYNYTVRVDDNGETYLDVGWNTREGRTYAADALDNLTLATAAALPEVGTKLTIDSADDVDWFKFTLETPGRSSSYIGIDFKQWAGDLDLYLYDSAGNQLDYAKSVTDNERISLKGFAAGDYYVKVEGYEGNVNEYKLDYNLPAPVVLTDEYELGNTPLSAVPLWTITGAKTISAAIQTADDVDYYSFALTRKGTTADSVTLTFDTDFGDLDLYLYDVSGLFLLGKSISTDSGTETISLAGLKNGLYVAKVVSKDGVTVANYDLTFSVREKDVQPDKYENNNSMKRATDLHTPNEAGSIDGLSIHSDTDVDYYKFSLLEKGSADDWIGISYEVSMGDLDLEILNAVGEVVAYSRTAENEDMVSLKGFEVGNYYIRVSGYNNVANNYALNWNVTNSSLIPSDSYEGVEPVAIRENQTITGLSIAKPVKEDETRADTFRIVLEYDAWKRSKIILTDYRSDWEEGMKYVIKDADGNILKEGTDSEISLYGLKKGEYDLTVDAPNENEYSEYSLIAQSLPDSSNPKDNTWSFFIYMAGDNNLEGCYLTELLYMQSAILPENVEVYVLLDRHEGWSTAQRDWTDTRVGKIRHSKGGAIAVEWMYFDGVNTNTYMNTQNLDLKKEWDTGKISTLEAFLDWGMQVGRAENYALIMKDHGSSLGYNCQDDESGSILAIDEIADLLRADKYKDLSVVAFDQCLMGSDVVISTMEGTVDYVVASEAVGYTPNLLVMYKVLLNSLETEMTPQEVSQKIVAACNCSGVVKLTMASFKTDEHALSEALQAFGETAKGFTREDWVAICKSFATAYNYGDEFWAYSDLGSFLSALKEYSTSISGTLMNATETLYDVVLNQLLDSTMITPTIYGSGLAVFNPVLSNDVISFYATGIGQTAWGDFLYTAGQIAEDCTEYFVDTRTNLTFTDFSYSIEDEAVLVTYNLGTFYGNGVEYNGLYVDKKAYFTVSLDQVGIDGDAIHVVADNPDANITIALIQKVYPLFGDPIKTARRTSTDGILSLAGVDPAKAGVDTEYDLVITTDRETTYSLSFVADWTSGSDFFDYTRSGSLGAQGNGSIDKATKLAAGNYGGLVTYAGDPDFYQLNTVYSDTLSVTVNGSGLTVQEYDVDGLLVQGAEYADGKYTIIVANGNYLRVEGNADLAAKEVNSYSLYISDVSSTYLSLGGTEIQLPEKPVVMDELKDNQVTVTLNMEAGMKGYHSSDLQIWDVCEDDTFVATDNGLYYFKSVDPETELESKYVSLRVVGIDHVLPTVSNVAANVTMPTNTDVIVTADFADDVALASSLYKIGENGEWLDYDTGKGVIVTENATVFFKAVDMAGNESEIASKEIVNIDKEPPVIVLSGDNTTSLQSSTLTASTEEGLDIFYSMDNATWTKYEGTLEVKANATYYFKSTDAAGNIGTAEYVFANIVQIPTLEVIPKTQTWEKVEDASLYVVEYSTDNFEHVIRLTVESNSLDSFRMPAGNYQWRVKAEGIDEWIVGEPVITAETDKGPKLVKSDEDGNADVFFANPIETWEAGYIAQHVGSINDWNGTNEYASVFGKNKLADMIEGSTDANILLMTDDSQGDSLFVDDIYTALPGSVAEQQARIARINEIRAGAGDDIVDMTSQRFEYIGDGLTIRGGDGNDVIWANKGDNFLFGDAGNDRIVGASGNDVIVGGIGNDSMHGGGGNDIFTFCDNWGKDTIEQLAGGSVTLWFAAELEGKVAWDEDSQSYTDGTNSVTVKGVAEVTLKFGSGAAPEDAARFAALSDAGAFEKFTSQKIFEESGKGFLASL